MLACTIDEGANCIIAYENCIQYALDFITAQLCILYPRPTSLLRMAGESAYPEKVFGNSF